MILAAWPSFDSWYNRWRIDVLTQAPGAAPKWRKHSVAQDGIRRAAFFDELELAQAECSEINKTAAVTIQSEKDEARRTSLRLRADKALQARKRLYEEEQFMLLEARRRRSNIAFNEADLVLHQRSEEHRALISAELRSFPYLELIIARLGRRPLMFLKLKDGSWSAPRSPNRKGVEAGRRSKIANGFGLSGLEHWGKTKAEIRRQLLPRANELLQLASVRRMLADALAQGKRALVWGSYVFWYEPGATPGWTVKERSSGSDGGDGEAIWWEGTIVSKNHGRIVVLPYIKEDGTRVTGHTKNAPHDGAALPRHSDEIVEIPFEELDGDLMIGLLGELPYE